MVLVVLFLPIAILTTGLVVDLGIAACAKKAVQAACDLGALAGAQALDWDSLSEGIVLIDPTSAQAIATQIAVQNMQACMALLSEITVWSTVRNPPLCQEPSVTVEAAYSPKAYFLRWIPGLYPGFHMTWVSEAAVVERTKW
jgi:uncharacterized membrane protein